MRENLRICSATGRCWASSCARRSSGRRCEAALVHEMVAMPASQPAVTAMPMVNVFAIFMFASLGPGLPKSYASARLDQSPIVRERASAGGSAVLAVKNPGGRAATRFAAKAVARRPARLERGRSKARPYQAPGLCLSTHQRGYWTNVPVRGGAAARYLGAMPIELERKFLVTGDGWRQEAQARGPGQRYRQGYLARGDVTVRVRIRGNGEEASLTIKSRRRGFLWLVFV